LETHLLHSGSGGSTAIPPTGPQRVPFIFAAQGKIPIEGVFTAEAICKMPELLPIKSEAFERIPPISGMLKC